MERTLAVQNAGSAEKREVWFQGDNPDTQKLFQEMVVLAIRERASDIHLQWYAGGLDVRLRIDGVLYKYRETIDQKNGTRLISACKLMADMKIDERRIPQDGRILVALEGKDFDLRVNCLPACFGENIVMRILDKNAVPSNLEVLGFDPETEVRFRKIICQPNGMMIFTGPTGSGKSTTQYAALSFLNTPGKKILTAENPVEYMVEGLTQVQVRGNLTFAIALRAFLRQDPDIIMIGEMRDLETAEVGIEAALTGHMVLSTLHTNNAPSAVTRLVDMGVPSHLIPDTVTGVLAQRLARRICENCREPYEADSSTLAFLGHKPQGGKTILYRGRGCENCRDGYKGRIGIFELLVMNEEVCALVCSNAPLAELRSAAARGGMKTLREDALRKVLAGYTTCAEVERVIYTAGS